MSWLTASEIAQATGENVRIVNRTASKEGWRRDAVNARKRSGRGGGWEYNICLLPREWQAKLSVTSKTVAANYDAIANPAPVVEDDAQEDPIEAMWQRYEQLPKKQKQICQMRLEQMIAVDEMMAQGLNETSAIKSASIASGHSMATLFNWRGMVRDLSRENYLAALAPKWKGAVARKDIHRDAWAVLKSDYLRAGEPAFSSCYRRMVKLAKQHGWEPIPAENVLRRKLKHEVPVSVQVMARKGRKKAKTLIPPQRRTVSHMHAMYAVNMDGHKLDIFVDLGNGQKVTRVILITIQDLYSRKYVGWRVGETENKDAVRLVIGDMVENHGIPEKMYVDNGHAFAAKSITGGIKNRYRFKVKDEDPKGLLTTLGVDVTFVTPAAGQSKPIERSFGDIAEEVSKHPYCDGAYTGNCPDNKPENHGKRAMKLDDLRKFVDEQIMEHNARVGRRTETAKGKSFDQVFNESVEDEATIIRWPTTAQKSLWLMGLEQVTAQRGSGVINLFGNRYFDQSLNAYAGKKVNVRFDPDYLKAGIRVYDIEDRLICMAVCIEDVGFDDVDAARATARIQKRFMKTTNELKRLHIDMSPKQLAEAYERVEKHPPRMPQKPSVVRLATSALAVAQPEHDPQVQWDADAEEGVSNFMKLVSSNEYDE